MNFLPAQTVPTPAIPQTFTAMLKAAWTGAKLRIGHATARFAQYDAAFPTATTTTGTRIGTNPNDAFASIQRVGMQWTGEDIAKNAPLCAAYLGVRQNYCSSLLKYIPATGDSGLDALVREYLHGEDGFGGVFGNMGVDCSMQDAFMRTADLEMPVRGDAGLIWYDDGSQMRLMEFSADQLGEVYYFTPPRSCALGRDADGEIVEVPGNDLVYFSGRYFKGCDCVAYKIYQRTNSWYGSPRIYQAGDVIYFRDPASFRGVRGVTHFAAAIQHLEKGERLFQIGMDAALRQAKTAMIVHNNRGQPDELSYRTTTDMSGKVTFSERLPQGPLVEYFYTGDTAEFASPDSPGPELIQGVETSDERVALAMRLNYAFLLSATKVGGAPSRLELNKAAKEFSRIQNQIHRPRLRVISRTAIMDGVRRGHLPSKANITKGSWMLPISPVVDAGYSNQENIDNLRAGLESPQDLVAETNRDWKDVVTKKKQAAIDVAKATEDGNRELVEAGYKPTITALDIAQLSDNPQQSAAAESIAEGKPAAGSPTTARLAEWDESKHPRAKDGEFGSGGSSSKKNDHLSHVEIHEDKTNSDFKNRVVETVRESLREYPQISKDLKAIRFDQNPGIAFADVVSRLKSEGSGSEIRVSKFHSQNTPEQFERNSPVKKDAASGLPFVSDSSIEGLANHELGHVFDNYIRRGLSDSQKEDFYEVKKSIPIRSEYAKKNRSEAFAELAQRILSKQGDEEDQKWWDDHAMKFLDFAEHGQP